jgi:hypothetical protein
MTKRSAATLKFGLMEVTCQPDHERKKQCDVRLVDQQRSNTYVQSNDYCCRMPRSTAPVCSPWRAPPRLLATFEEWADPRCQTILERCAIVLPCRGRLAPPARGMTLPASHASTLPLHVLSHHSTTIVSVAAKFFRPHTKESVSLSWRTLDTTFGTIKCALPTPGASNPRRPDSTPKSARFDDVPELAACLRTAQLTATDQPHDEWCAH